MKKWFIASMVIIFAVLIISVVVSSNDTQQSPSQGVEFDIDFHHKKKPSTTYTRKRLKH